MSFSDVAEKVLKILEHAAQEGATELPFNHLCQWLIHNNHLSDTVRDQQFRRAYNYLVHLKPRALKLGWEPRTVNGRKCYCFICLVVRNEDYSLCSACNRRVECLLAPLPFPT
jgi:hypothetical protein